MKTNFGVSEVLIALSFIGFLGIQLYPGISTELGLNSYYLEKGEYLHYIVQIFSSEFLHGSIFHFLFNAIFVYYFGKILEGELGVKKYIAFFIFTAIFTSIGLTYIAQNPGTVIGISGFCMALISYYTLLLWERNNPEYKGGITAIIINIGIGFYPGISLYGHLFGAIAGVLFYLFTREYIRRKMIGLFVKQDIA